MSLTVVESRAAYRQGCVLRKCLLGSFITVQTAQRHPHRPTAAQVVQDCLLYTWVTWHSLFLWGVNTVTVQYYTRWNQAQERAMQPGDTINMRCRRLQLV